MGDQVLLRLEGDLDLMAVPYFLHRLEVSLGAPPVQAVVVDMGGLSFLDVAGARALIAAGGLARAKGARPSICGLSHGALPVARAMHLRQYFAGGEDAEARGGGE